MKILFLLLLLLFNFSTSQNIVELSIQDLAQVARIDEPITIGVPLPKGWYTDTSGFVLSDATGAVIPCEFRIANKWWTDKSSIRWLHLDFQTGIDSAATKKIYLGWNPALHGVTGSKLSVTNGTDKITVNTGKIRFTVKKKNFNLFDEVWVDESGAENYSAANQVVGSHTRGIVQKIGAAEYVSSNDANSNCVVKRAGPMSVALRAEGSLRTGSGTGGFRFIAWIYAYNNSKTVRVTLSWENREASITGSVQVNEISMQLPTLLNASPSFCIGGENTVYTGTLGGSESAFIQCHQTTSFTVGGKGSGSGNPQTNKPYDLGWVSLGNGQKGIAAGRRYFWQMHPAANEIKGDGTVILGLISHKYPTALQIFSGQSRTHFIRFSFFNDDSNDEKRAVMVGEKSMLFPACSKRWYCRIAQCFGLHAEATSNLYPLMRRGQYGTIQGALVNRYALMMDAIEMRTKTGVTRDSYGYLHWGDGFHYAYSTGAGLDPWNLQWNGNYYDLPYMYFMEYIRTGNLGYLDFCFRNATHIQDIHQAHLGPTNPTTGAQRYCPPTNHVGQDNNTPAYMGHTSHHKTQSMFAKYYFFCDERALELALDALEWIFGRGTGPTTGGDLTGYPRRGASALWTLTYGYKHNFNTKYLNLANSHAQNVINYVNGTATPYTGNSSWQSGFLQEGLIDLYEITPIAQIPAIIKKWVDNGGSGRNSGIGFAFVGEFYNDTTYLTKAFEWADGFAGYYSNVFKMTAEDGRTQPKMLSYFAYPESLDVVDIERPVLKSMPQFSFIEAFPNPFNPVIKIAVSCPALAGSAISKKTVPIKIYNVNGKIVKELTTDSRQLKAGINWNASQYPPGVYILKLKIAGKQYTKCLVLQ
jgi:hypothetical protein